MSDAGLRARVVQPEARWFDGDKARSRRRSGAAGRARRCGRSPHPCRRQAASHGPSGVQDARRCAGGRGCGPGGAVARLEAGTFMETGCGQVRYLAASGRLESLLRSSAPASRGSDRQSAGPSRSGAATGSTLVAARRGASDRRCAHGPAGSAERGLGALSLSGTVQCRGRRPDERQCGSLGEPVVAWASNIASGIGRPRAGEG